MAYHAYCQHPVTKGALTATSFAANARSGPVDPMQGPSGPEHLGLWRPESRKPGANRADIVLDLRQMKPSTLTLVVLSVVLVPWLAAVARADWIRARRTRAADVPTGGR